MNQSLTTDHVATTRNATLDVARAIAMFGVVALNYHAYLNTSLAWAPKYPSSWERLFNPGTGVLTTRFAAVFVLIAGVGVTLLTRASRKANDPVLLQGDRLRLLRRGMLLYVVGYALEWIWPGTILLYYGAFFIIASLIFASPTRRVLAIGVASTSIAAGIAWWRTEQSFSGNLTTWLTPAKMDSPRDLLISTFVSYTHPVFPWLLFFTVGIIVGRHLHQLAALRRRLIFWSTFVLAATYLINTLIVADTPATNTDRLIAAVFSTRPYDRGLLYSFGTLASSLIALCIVSMVVESLGENSVVDMFARAGQMSLSIYLAHIFFFNLIVHSLRWVGATGLDTALGLALVFYAIAIPLSALWRIYFGRGPAEILYRAFGG